MKRPVRRPPLSFLPLMLLLWGGMIWGMVGCGMLTGFGGGDNATLARDQIAIALAALKQGDERGTDAALGRAAAALSEPGQAPGRAVSEVAGVLTRSGNAAAAAHFLEAARTQPEMAWDPLVWSALADADASANNTAGASAARSEADRRAGDILQTISRSASPKDNAAGQRLLEAGLYYGSAAKNDSLSALRALREADRMLPDDPAVMNAFGYMLADRGTTAKDWDDAKILTRDALQAQPDRPEILDSYGWALFKRGETAGARRVLNAAADALSDDPTFHFHLGSVYAALGRTDDARLELLRALQIDPRFEDAARARELARSLK